MNNKFKVLNPDQPKTAGGSTPWAVPGIEKQQFCQAQFLLLLGLPASYVQKLIWNRVNVKRIDSIVNFYLSEGLGANSSY